MLLFIQAKRLWYIVFDGTVKCCLQFPGLRIKRRRTFEKWQQSQRENPSDNNQKKMSRSSLVSIVEIKLIHFVSLYFHVFRFW